MTKLIPLGRQANRPGLLRTVVRDAKVLKQLALSPEARDEHRAQQKLAIDDEEEEEEDQEEAVLIKKGKTAAQQGRIILTVTAGSVICLPFTVVAGMIITPVVAIHMASKGFFRPENQHALMVDLRDDTEYCASAYLKLGHADAKTIRFIKHFATVELEQKAMSISKPAAICATTLQSPLAAVWGAINASAIVHYAV